MIRSTSLRALAASAIGGALMAAAALAFPLQAAAGSSPPATQWSFYIYSTSTTTAYNLGCNQGTSDLNNAIPATLVWLDFGNQLPNGSGTEEVFDQFTFSNAQIESLADEYADGFYYCTGSDTTSHLYLSVGTRNSQDVTGNGTTYGNGQTWSSVVSAVQSHMNSSFCYNGRCKSAQTTAWAANDMEPSWNSASNTINWANGFGASGGVYVNYGSADGCPSGSYSNGSCNNGWNQYDVWYVSWGATPALASPEIYYSVNASQWTMISLYGDHYQGGDSAYYEGPLDEYDLNSSTNTSAQAWSQLWNDLNNNGLSGVANGMGYSLEVHDE